LAKQREELIRTYLNKIFRRVFGLFWPLFDSRLGGQYRSSIYAPQALKSKIGSKEPKNRLKLFIEIGSSRHTVLNMSTSWVKKKLLAILVLVCFFVFVFASARQTGSQLEFLTKGEKESLRYLLREIIDRESGAYVLFGSKPLCTGFLKSAPSNEASSCDLRQAWQAWNKVTQRFSMERYILTQKPLTMQVKTEEGKEEQFSLQMAVLADIEKTTAILSDHYDLFKSLIGKEFQPRQMVLQLDQSDSSFWNQIFGLEENGCSSVERNQALGLLFGFGEKNARLFTSQAQDKKKLLCRGSLEYLGENHLIWADFLYGLGVNMFLIPGFVAFEGDRLVDGYKLERKKIQTLYRGRDFLQVTLSQLLVK
jgi:hypothetical protein